MFFAEETSLPVSFGSARNWLAGLVREGVLLTIARQTYETQGGRLTRVAPFGGAPGASRLVEVQLGDLVMQDARAMLPLRWKAAGRSGALFPVLDANLMLSAKGEQASLLRLAGVYRPPLGPVGAELDDAPLNRVASTTIQAFLSGLADTVAV
jgi:hypothetical protein